MLMRNGMKRAADPDAVGELGDLICRVADDIARDEARLREQIIDLIEQDDTAAATALLRAWNTTAAGDLLKALTENSRG